METLLTNSI